MEQLRTLMDTPEHPSHGVLSDRKSEFLGDACHVASLSDALRFVKATKNRHPKARHVAFAALVGGYAQPVAERMSDDGEPSGTAGKPILDTLRVTGLTDCVVCVTRYFGGILLGSGGLIRAYAGCASRALERAQMAELVEFQQYACDVAYSQLRSMNKLVEDHAGVQISAEYTDRVRLLMEVPTSGSVSFEMRIREVFNAGVKPLRLARVQRPVARRHVRDADNG